MKEIVSRVMLAAIAGITFTMFALIVLSGESNKLGGVPMYPAGWAWFTLVSFVLMGGGIVWTCLTPKSANKGAFATLIIAGPTLVFLFSFMQWASWYI